MPNRRCWVVALCACAGALLVSVPVRAQDCPPEVRALAPQNGSVTACSYASLSTTMSIEMSGQVPRPELPEQPYTFSVRVVRAKLTTMARRKDAMARDELAKMEAAEESTRESSPMVGYGPTASKAIAGGKAWYRKVTVGSIGEKAPVREHYECDYYVVDGMTMITFKTTSPGVADSDIWLARLRTRLEAVQ